MAGHGKKYTGTLDRYKTSYLRCRGPRSHKWRHATDERVVWGPAGRVLEFTQVSVCQCTAERRQKVTITREGRFVKNGDPVIAYPDGYLLDKDAEGFEPADTFDELMARDLNRTSPELASAILSQRLGEGTSIPRHLKAV